MQWHTNPDDGRERKAMMGETNNHDKLSKTKMVSDTYFTGGNRSALPAARVWCASDGPHRYPSHARDVPQEHAVEYALPLLHSRE
jgi:hypothetical protein